MDTNYYSKLCNRRLKTISNRRLKKYENLNFYAFCKNWQKFEYKTAQKVQKLNGSLQYFQEFYKSFVIKKFQNFNFSKFFECHLGDVG